MQNSPRELNPFFVSKLRMEFVAFRPEIWDFEISLRALASDIPARIEFSWRKPPAHSRPFFFGEIWIIYGVYANGASFSSLASKLIVLRKMPGGVDLVRNL